MSFKKLRRKKILLLVVLLFLFLSLVSAFYLSQRSQETRKEAAPATETQPDILKSSSSFEERKKFFDKDYFKNYLWEQQLKITPEIIEADKKAEYKKLPQYQRFLNNTQASTPVIVPILLIANGEIYYPQHLTTINTIMIEIESWYQRETGFAFQIGSTIVEQSNYSVKDIYQRYGPARFLGPNTITMVFFQGGGGFAGCYAYSNRGGTCVMGDWLLEVYNCASADFTGCIRSEIQKANVSTDPSFLDPDNNGVNNFLMIPWYWGCWYEPYNQQNYQRCRAQYNQAEPIRQALYTAAHELGHGFDLPHPEGGYANYIGPSIMTGWRTWPDNILSHQVFYDEASHTASTPFFTGDGSLFNSDHPGLYGLLSIAKRNNLLTIDGYNLGVDSNTLRVVVNTVGGPFSLPVFCISGSRMTVILPTGILPGSFWITKQGLKSKISFAIIYDEQGNPITSVNSTSPMPTPTLIPTLSPGERCRLLLIGGTNHTVNETIKIMVQQNPKFAGNGSCYYGQMEVKKGGQTVCTASGFNIIPSCQTITCEWNTQGTAAGIYSLSSYYGGHGDGCPSNPCCDNTYTCYADVVLNPSSPAPTHTPTPTPTPMTCQEMCSNDGYNSSTCWNNCQTTCLASACKTYTYGKTFSGARDCVAPKDTTCCCRIRQTPLTCPMGCGSTDYFGPCVCIPSVTLTPTCPPIQTCVPSGEIAAECCQCCSKQCSFIYQTGQTICIGGPTATPTNTPTPTRTPTPTLTLTPTPTFTLTPSPTSTPTPTPSRFPCDSNCAYNAQCTSNYCWPVNSTCRNPKCPANIYCWCP